MEWLFGRKKTPAEMMRESQRSLKKAMRYVTLYLSLSILSFFFFFLFPLLIFFFLVIDGGPKSQLAQTNAVFDKGAVSMLDPTRYTTMVVMLTTYDNFPKNLKHRHSSVYCPSSFHTLDSSVHACCASPALVIGSCV